jgi:hypothetical protein
MSSALASRCERSLIKPRLGLGLVKAYASRPGYTVVSAVRNPDTMPQVQTAEGSRVVVIKLDAGVGEDAEEVCPRSGNYELLQLMIGLESGRERAWHREDRYCQSIPS